MTSASATTLSPRLIVHVVVASTDATVTSAPARTRVSVMQQVSISSEPSAIGTRTRFTAPALVVAAARSAKLRSAELLVASVSITATVVEGMRQ